MDIDDLDWIGPAPDQPMFMRAADFGSRVRELNRLLMQSRVHNDQPLHFDQSSYFRPLTTTITALLLKGMGVGYRVVGTKTSTFTCEEYLQLMDYPDGSLPSELDVQQHSRYVPLILIDSGTVSRAQWLEELAIASELLFELIQKILPASSQVLQGGAIRLMLSEMIENAREHSGGTRVAITAQLIPRLSVCEVAIADDGLGIMGTVKRRFTTVKTHEEAIRGVIENRWSGRDPHLYHEPGTGIVNTRRQLIGEKLGGSFSLISGNTAYHESHGTPGQYHALSEMWPGTVVMLKFRTNVTTPVNWSEYVH